MTSEERRRYMRMLSCAKRGDEIACNRLTEVVSYEHRYMVLDGRCHSSDPAVDRDDIMSRFREGIWIAIPRVDGRGDPLFHLAQRGLWQVLGWLIAIDRRRHGTEVYKAEHGERSIGVIPEGFDLPDERPEADPAYAVIRSEEVDAASGQVAYIVAHAKLFPRERDTLQWIMADPDPWEKGANQRLATELGVSEQRASVLRKNVLNKLCG